MSSTLTTEQAKILAAEQALPGQLQRLLNIIEADERGLMTWQMMRARLAKEVYDTLGTILYGEGPRE